MTTTIPRKLGQIPHVAAARTGPVRAGPHGHRGHSPGRVGGRRPVHPAHGRSSRRAAARGPASTRGVRDGELPRRRQHPRGAPGGGWPSPGRRGMDDGRQRHRARPGWPDRRAHAAAATLADAAQGRALDQARPPVHPPRRRPGAARAGRGGSPLQRANGRARVTDAQPGSGHARRHVPGTGRRGDAGSSPPRTAGFSTCSTAKRTSAPTRRRSCRARSAGSSGQRATATRRSASPTAAAAHARPALRRSAPEHADRLVRPVHRRHARGHRAFVRAIPGRHLPEGLSLPSATPATLRVAAARASSFAAASASASASTKASMSRRRCGA